MVIGWLIAIFSYLFLVFEDIRSCEEVVKVCVVEGRVEVCRNSFCFWFRDKESLVFFEGFWISYCLFLNLIFLFGK